jgi:predicted RecB family nuclease
MNLRLASPFHLHGVGPAYTWKLALCNIQTIGELLEHKNIDELSETSGIPYKVLDKIRLKARAIVNNEVIQLESFKMPDKEFIYLDIETVPKWNKVWLIGLMVGDEFIQLYAKDYDDEKRILSEFIEIIDSYREQFLVTWTGFDTRVLNKRLDFHGLPASLLNMLGHVDLNMKIWRSFIFPTRGYGLKKIGYYLGYPFRNPSLDGLIVSSQYQSHIERKEDLDSRIFSYNEDDVKVLPFIEQWGREYT